MWHEAEAPSCHTRPSLMWLLLVSLTYLLTFPASLHSSAFQNHLDFKWVHCCLTPPCLCQVRKATTSEFWLIFSRLILSASCNVTPFLTPRHNRSIHLQRHLFHEAFAEISSAYVLVLPFLWALTACMFDCVRHQLDLIWDNGYLHTFLTHGLPESRKHFLNCLIPHRS